MNLGLNSSTKMTLLAKRPYNATGHISIHKKGLSYHDNSLRTSWYLQRLGFGSACHASVASAGCSGQGNAKENPGGDGFLNWGRNAPECPAGVSMGKGWRAR